MTKFAKRLALVLGFSLLAVGLSFLASTPTPAASTGAPVNITTVTVPSVPVSGTVNVGNTPSVNVASLPSVSIAGNINAAVSNPVGNAGPVPLVIQDSENPAHTAFEVFNSCGFNGASDCTISPLFTVPAGEIAVIESASGQCLTDPGGNLFGAQINFAGPSSVSSASFFVPIPTSLFNGFTQANFAQNLRAYAFGGTNGTPIIFTAGSTDSTSINCTVAMSGHLVKQ